MTDNDDAMSDDEPDAESASLGNNPKFLAIIERSRISHDRDGGISSDELRRRLGLPARQPKSEPLD